MSKLKTLLLHPDCQVRSELRTGLQSAGFLQVVGEAACGFEAMELIEHIDYGAVMLGVDIPDGPSGFEIGQMLAGRKARPALVFLAPDESHAYRAFELGATDFLLLPVNQDRLEMTIDKLKQFKTHFKEIPAPSTFNSGAEDFDEEETVQLPLGDEEEELFLQALRHAWDMQKFRSPQIEKLAVNQDGRVMLIPYDQIIFVEAYEDYCYVHTANQKILASYRLKILEDRLKPFRFFRVHRKYLVNLDMVTEIASLPGSNFMLRTVGKTRIELPISRRRIAQLKEILGL
ncbi:MAG: LytR/AlgR family response regulator transcription factor [Desulfovibrionaceae bacterium]